MANARDVVTYILEKAGPMTAMKLQKLVYYSQAWHLVRADHPLFDEQIEAWAAGPVVRDLYNVHRGKYTVGAETFGGDSNQLNPSERASVDVVLNHYGKYTAEQLSDLTHSEPPWQRAREGLGPTERGSSVIDPLEMVDYYGQLGRRR